MRNEHFQQASTHGSRPAAPRGRRLRHPQRGNRAPAQRRGLAWFLLVVFQVAPPGLPAALAAPVGEQVVSGEATFERDGTHTLITTTTHETIVDYDGFDIAVDESVRIDQPNESSRILNRVYPGAPTQIDGSLSSNGIVYILNASGVFFGGEAIVDVARIVAGAGTLSNHDFLSGIDHFTDLSGAVEVANGARIEASAVALIGRTVANHGAILSRDGMIALVAGGDVVLSDVDGHLSIRVEPAPEDPGAWAIQQTGTLDAGTGSVMLTAGDAYSLAMNHQGITRARDIQLEAGDDGLLVVEGTLDASNRESGGHGGSIRVLGDLLAVLDAEIDASGDAGGGEILIGGDTRGAGDTRTARRTFVDADARLRADALTQGDGGKIIIWADEQAAFYGTLSARGGAQGGDGGFAEISGKQSLVSHGSVDLSATSGLTGTLLYDPENIRIVGGTFDGSDAPDLSPELLAGDDGFAGTIFADDNGNGDDPFVIYESEIEGTDANIVLEASRSVTVSGTLNSGTPSDFTDGEVRLQSGLSLTIVTQSPGDATNEPDKPDLGINLVDDADGVAGNGDLKDLVWVVSGGGSLNFGTAFDSEATGDAAPILLGVLQVEDAAIINSAGVDFPATAVLVATEYGDIEIERIVTRGADPTGDDVASETLYEVDLLALRGDIRVGAIDTSGEAPGSDPTDGALGGDVRIETPLGGIEVGGLEVAAIDTSGGDGLPGIIEDGDESIPVGRGGDAGVINLIAGSGIQGDSAGRQGFKSRRGTGLAGFVTVTGDLTAVGGSAGTNEGGVADGGRGGVVLISAAAGDVSGDITIGAESNPVTIDVSGGDGGNGGDGEDGGEDGGNGGDAGVIQIASGSAGGNITLHAGLVARGGNGGSGGNGGIGEAGEAGGAGADSAALISGAGHIIGSLTALETNSLFVTQRSASATTDLSGPDGLAMKVTAGTLTSLNNESENIDALLSYELDAGAETLTIARGAVSIGTAGGRIANSGGAIVGAEGTGGPHAVSKGDLTLEGTDLGSVETASPLEIQAADSDARLVLIAAGDVRVDLTAGSGERFHMVDLTQRDVSGDTFIQHVGANELSTGAVEIAGNADTQTSQIKRIDPQVSEAFAYRLDAPPAVPEGGDDVVEARIEIVQIRLGADVLVSAPGDIVIAGLSGEAAIEANGFGVDLVADSNADTLGAILDAGDLEDGTVAIDMGDPAQRPVGLLSLAAGSGIGTQDAPLRTRDLDRVAGTTATGDFRLRNTAGDDFRISEVEDFDGVIRSGITATTGDVVLANDAGSILLAQLESGFHVDSGGDQTFESVVEIDNARLDGVDAPSNEARLRAGGDVIFLDRVATSTKATVTIALDGGAEANVVVPGALLISSGGSAQFGADVGASDPLDPLDPFSRLGRLGRIETDDLLLVGDTTFYLGADPAEIVDAADSVDLGAFVGRADFGGEIDGAYALTAIAMTGMEDSPSTVVFGGDIGVSERITALDVDADRIEFTTAERVRVGDDGIRLNVPADDLETSGAPAVATIYDTSGGLTFETSGDFETGRLQKLSALGPLTIRAQGSASFGDIAALELLIDAPTINWKGREPGTLLLADGSTAKDQGSELVANDIVFTSQPIWDLDGVVPDVVPTLVIGSGGVSAPESLGEFRVIRFNASLDAITTANLVGQDGVILDLTGTGPPVVGNPATEIPHAPPALLPVVITHSDHALPAPRTQVPGPVVLAYLRCAEFAGSAGGTCSASDMSSMTEISKFRDSALSTQRAADIALRYRALEGSSDGRARLRASFKLATRDYRAQETSASLDGAQFYAFLRTSRAHEVALAQLNELARIFTEIEMLGLEASDSAALQHALAEEFAEVIGEPDFDANDVIEATRASGIGLPS